MFLSLFTGRRIRLDVSIRSVLSRAMHLGIKPYQTQVRQIYRQHGRYSSDYFLVPAFKQTSSPTNTSTSAFKHARLRQATTFKRHAQLQGQQAPPAAATATASLLAQLPRRIPSLLLVAGTGSVARKALQRDRAGLSGRRGRIRSTRLGGPAMPCPPESMSRPSLSECPAWRPSGPRLGATLAGVAAFPATLRSGRAKSLRPGRLRPAPGRRLPGALRPSPSLSYRLPSLVLSLRRSLHPWADRPVCPLSRDSSVFLCHPPCFPPSLSPSVRQ